MDQKLVVKSNHVIEASYRLTLSEQRLILLCVQKIKKGKALSETDGFTIKASEFASLFNISTDRAYSELQAVVDRLYERSVTIHQPTPENPKLTTTRTRWVSAIDYMGSEGCITLHFATKMLPYISMLEGGFTRYNLENIARMKSSYGIRFYEFFKCWMFGLPNAKKTISVDELKEMLVLTGKYQSIKDFKLYVLDKAISDINNFSDLTAKYTPMKTGRKVTHIEFAFSLKKPKEFSKSQLEKHARPGESYSQVKKRLSSHIG